MRFQRFCMVLLYNGKLCAARVSAVKVQGLGLEGLGLGFGGSGPKDWELRLHRGARRPLLGGSGGLRK